MDPDQLVEPSLTLAKVRSELDELAERRLYYPPTAQEAARWQELVTIEEQLLKRRREPGR